MCDICDDIAPVHVEYPHNPGYLYDCPACEAECYCDPTDTSTVECVHCAILRDEMGHV